jgi:hypothetical protein
VTIQRNNDLFKSDRSVAAAMKGKPRLSQKACAREKSMPAERRAHPGPRHA